MNKYRVDVNNVKHVPCGMNSIKYIGDSFQKAKTVFDSTNTGYDAWGNENCTYGVILSVWDAMKNDYIIKAIRGFN